MGDSTGEPRRWKPVVSSARISGAKWFDLLVFLREYFAMVLDMEAARVQVGEGVEWGVARCGS